MRKNGLFLLLSLFFVSACGLVAINENDYRFLPAAFKGDIKPFDLSVVTKKVNYHDSLYLYEINTPEIKAVLKKHQYVWLHIWRPYCEADYCQNISYFTQLVRRYQDRDFQLLLISEVYNPPTIKKVMAHSTFDKPVFVLQDAWYGHKIKKSYKLLFHQINNNPAIHSKRGFDEYLFKDSLLIYAGNKITARMLDSLVKHGDLSPYFDLVK